MLIGVYIFLFRFQVTRLLLDDGDLFKERVIIEILHLPGNVEQALHGAEIRNGFSLNSISSLFSVCSSGNLGYRSKLAVVASHLIYTFLERSPVCVCPPVYQSTVLIILGAFVIKGVGDLMPYDHAKPPQLLFNGPVLIIVIPATDAGKDVDGVVLGHIGGPQLAVIICIYHVAFVSSMRQRCRLP